MESKVNRNLHRALADFANRVGLTCSLEVGGKMSPEEAYSDVRKKWKELKKAYKKNLGLTI